MKTTICLLSATLLTSVASAFTVSTSNVEGSASSSEVLPVTDESTSLIPTGSGIVAAGFFSTLTDSQINATNIGLDFQIHGSASFAASSFGNPDGVFNLSGLGGTISDGSPFIGETVYIVIGNGPDLSSSSQFAVWNSGNMFAKTEDIPTTSVGVTPSNQSQLVFGSIGGSATTGGTEFDNSLVLSSIPEPSVTILGLLGMLGLLRRRR